jgi:hypothetical protein
MAKKKKGTKIPQSSEAKAARQAIIAADLIGWEADRSRLSSLSRGSYTGAPNIRASGSAIRSRYRVGSPKPDKGYAGYYGLKNDKGKRSKPISGKAPKGSGKAMLKRAGGTQADLSKWRKLGALDRGRIKRQVRRGGNATRLVRSRFRR